MKNIILQFNFTYIKNYQNDNIIYEKLSITTPLNINSDRLATEYLDNIIISQIKIILYNGVKYQLYINQ